MSHSSSISVGFFPCTLPRDPLYANLFLEHLFLNQILVPLIKLAPDGTVGRGVATEWDVRKNGSEIHFLIDSNARFSNGAKVTSEDAKFTLSRHLHSKESQSHELLKSVEDIVTPSDQEILIRFSEPDPAFLKILSRSHLGIVPRNWRFDADSVEPIIGSGPFRLIFNREEWELRPNIHHATDNGSKPLTIQIVRETLLPQEYQETPDILLYLEESKLRALRKRSQTVEEDFQILTPVHFLQTSAWWNPMKTIGIEGRLKAMKFIEYWIKEALSRVGHQCATGLFPPGISGNLSERPQLGELTTHPTPTTPLRLTVSMTSREQYLLDVPSIFEDLKRRFKIDIKIVEAQPNLRLSDFNETIDVAFRTTGGAFADAEGFIAPVLSFFGVSLEQLFREDTSTYLEAKSEHDWLKRNSKFGAFAKTLHLKGVVVPGWKLDLKSLFRKGINVPIGPTGHTTDFNELSVNESTDRSLADNTTGYRA